jgi:hypothetical protein
MSTRCTFLEWLGEHVGHRHISSALKQDAWQDGRDDNDDDDVTAMRRGRADVDASPPEVRDMVQFGPNVTETGMITKIDWNQVTVLLLGSGKSITTPLYSGRSDGAALYYLEPSKSENTGTWWVSLTNNQAKEWDKKGKFERIRMRRNMSMGKEHLPSRSENPGNDILSTLRGIMSNPPESEISSSNPLDDLMQRASQSQKNNAA